MLKFKDNRGAEFGCTEDLEDLSKTSLLFYSDEEVAYLKVGGYYLSLMVRGEVTINYKGERYKNYGQYSEELKNILRSDKDWFEKAVENGDFELIDNNWFNLEFCKINKDLEKNGVSPMEFLFDDCDFDIDIGDDINDMPQKLFLQLVEVFKSYQGYEELEDFDFSLLDKIFLLKVEDND